MGKKGRTYALVFSKAITGAWKMNHSIRKAKANNIRRLEAEAKSSNPNLDITPSCLTLIQPQ